VAGDDQSPWHDHERRIISLESITDDLRVKQAVIDERQHHHGVEMASLRELMMQLTQKVSESTRLVSSVRDDVIGRLNTLLIWLIGGISAAVLAVGVSILSWWLDRM